MYPASLKNLGALIRHGPTRVAFSPPIYGARCGGLDVLRPPAARLSRDFRTNTSLRSIELSELRSGGPPKDGIPAIDAPRFVTHDEASEWLAGHEPIILVRIDESARIYPLQILTFHEIVNDVLEGTPLAVNIFAPSAIALSHLTGVFRQTKERHFSTLACPGCSATPIS